MNGTGRACHLKGIAKVACHLVKKLPIMFFTSSADASLPSFKIARKVRKNSEYYRRIGKKKKKTAKDSKGNVINIGDRVRITRTDMADHDY